MPGSSDRLAPRPDESPSTLRLVPAERDCRGEPRSKIRDEQAAAAFGGLRSTALDMVDAARTEGESVGFIAGWWRGFVVGVLGGGALVAATRIELLLPARWH